jgi:HsdM N-terminal domain
MITGELKSQVDKIWNDFWTGGISNPLTVIEQFTYLIFLKQLDDKQILIEKEIALLGSTTKKPKRITLELLQRQRSGSNVRFIPQTTTSFERLNRF